MLLTETNLNKGIQNILRRHAAITTTDQLIEEMKDEPDYIKGLPQLGPKRYQEVLRFTTTFKPEWKIKEKIIPTICPYCKETLTREKWNTKVDILVCDNSKCTNYRTPAGCVDTDFKGILNIFKKE